jgi:hypothetical protein
MAMGRIKGAVRVSKIVTETGGRARADGAYGEHGVHTEARSTRRRTEERARPHL